MTAALACLVPSLDRIPERQTPLMIPLLSARRSPNPTAVFWDIFLIFGSMGSGTGSGLPLLLRRFLGSGSAPARMVVRNA